MDYDVADLQTFLLGSRANDYSRETLVRRLYEERGFSPAGSNYLDMLNSWISFLKEKCLYVFIRQEINDFDGLKSQNGYFDAVIRDEIELTKEEAASLNLFSECIEHCLISVLEHPAFHLVDFGREYRYGSEDYR